MKQPIYSEFYLGDGIYKFQCGYHQIICGKDFIDNIDKKFKDMVLEYCKIHGK
jgi:hypothetical protein